MNKDKFYEYLLAFVFGFATFGFVYSIFKINSDQQTVVECKPILELSKQHKFHYNDEIVVVNGFYKGVSGKIRGYYENSDEYIVLPDDSILSFYVKDSEIELKNKKDKLVDFFLKDD